MPSSIPAQYGYLRKRDCRFLIAKAYPAVHTDPLGQGFPMARPHLHNDHGDDGSLGSLTIRNQPLAPLLAFRLSIRVTVSVDSPPQGKHFQAKLDS